jgi:hypothetical protein
MNDFHEAAAMRPLLAPLAPDLPPVRRLGSMTREFDRRGIPMRTFVTVVVLSLGTATQGAAQTIAHQDAASLQAPPSESAQTGLAPEPPAIAKMINWFDREVNQGGGPKDGFYPEFGNMITGSG